METAGGVALLAATAIALIWANSPWGDHYTTLWGATIPRDLAGPGVLLPDFIAAHPLHFWIDDGLMTLFFLVVGLEIRHELRHGALSDPRIARLPILAALAGVLVPALIYLLLNTDAVSRRGWAVPTATDIAFAVGILSLLGKGVPPALRMLLLTVAIVDDIVAVFIIASTYSKGIGLPGVALAGAGALLVWIMQRLRIRAAPAYILPGVLIWFGLLRAGIHPALAGVVLGLMAPANAQSNHLQRLLHPWVAYAVMPLFALANAGVSFKALSLEAGLPRTVGLGIIFALVVGKPLGIVAGAAAAVRSGVCTLPAEVRWSHMALLGCLGGIGFTMSIFIANLAFPDPTLLAASKCAVLIASTVAATAGLLAGRYISVRVKE
ncbi:MAG: sodium:proton antiporter [Gammaproteobacteria bacterium]|nr:sodium:proton antiporter [Gammaproteobacteria bacterium]